MNRGVSPKAGFLKWDLRHVAPPSGEKKHTLSVQKEQHAPSYHNVSVENYKRSVASQQFEKQSEILTSNGNLRICIKTYFEE